MKIKQKSNGDFKLTLSPLELTTIQSILMKVRLGSGKQADSIFNFIEGVEAFIPDSDLFPTGVDVELDPKYGVDFSINVDKSVL